MTLKDRLVAYMQRHHTEWVASGALQRIVVEKTSYTPRTAVRRLEELAERGVLQVEYRKGHAFYKFNEGKTNEQLRLESIKWFDSLPTKQ